ncbi:MAG TPA: hypothetical protein VHX14_02480 [Thermoanaerobaculia bacterium]|nr:hypothetical protein [Thermoanaerobaculia bacterium]
MHVEPTRRISHFETAGGSPAVVIPGRLRLVAIFLLFWVSFWTYGGITTIRALRDSLNQGKPEWFLAVWLIGWSAGELMVLGILSYMLAGRETITLRPSQMELRLQIAAWGFSRQYDITKVQNARVSTTAGRNQFPAALAFDYGAKTIRFGREIDEAEAALVLTDLQSTGLLPHST